jgi:hypothetical protein
LRYREEQAITGRVLDEFGDPVAARAGTAVPSSETRRLTDRRHGAKRRHRRLRLYGLMPGDYFVSHSAGPAERRRRQGRLRADMHQGTGSVTEAQAVPLGLAEEANISFALMAVRQRGSRERPGFQGTPFANGSSC